MKRNAEISTSQLHSDTESNTNDLSILRKPIKTSVTGLNEARKAYEDGTDEVRRLLANECDIIYECKVCRNIFRSLANFISHKRIYCKTTFSLSMHLNFHNDGNSLNQDVSTIIQAENAFIGAARNGKTHDKDLSSIIDRLVKREKASRMMKLSDFYEQVNNKLTQDQLLQKRHVLHLDVVPETNAAVYQTVKNANNDSNDTIKTEVIEVQDLMDDSRNVLGPDGKIVDASELPKHPNDDLGVEQSFECEICNSKFATEKTLKLHIETKHIPSTYVFQCPSCSRTFLQVGQVIRHLTNDHKKSMRRVRLMRDTILKRRTRIDEVQVKGPSRELARLQTDKEKADAQNKAWLDNLENNDNSGSICMYCGKKFERRAVLLSHQKSCQQKKKPSNRITLTRKVENDKQNGWNVRDYDDSSNSNSLDGAYLDDNVVSTSTSTSNSTSVKAEKSLKSELEADATETATTNKRKRNRAAKAVISDDANQSGDDKSLNICWNADIDANFEIKEERLSPPDVEMDLSDSGSNLNANDVDPETKMDVFMTEEAKSAKDDRKSRSATNGNKFSENKVKEKMSTSHCLYCHKKFSNPSNLRRHIMALHLQPSKFTCNLCTTREFRAHRKVDVIHHLRTKHQFDGERADALKFITAKEEPVQKPPSISRRKERHTEVLKDDEEEIFIENEPLAATEEVVENFSSLDTSNDNSNADIDDQSVINNANEVNDDTESSETMHSKRKGRPKAGMKESIKNIERILVFEDKKDATQSLPAKRPVRNRIMPVKKDFVYDLSTLLKKDTAIYKELQQQHELQKQLTQPQLVAQIKSRNTSPTPSISNKTTKRRNTLPETASADDHDQPNALDEQKPITVTNTAINSELIRGAAEMMAQKAIRANRAALCELPELPAWQKPSVNLTAPRIFDPAIIKDWPILKKSSSSSLSDSTKSKLPSQKVPGLKRKKRPCLLKYTPNKTTHHHKSRFHNKHKVGNGNGTAADSGESQPCETAETIKISSKIANKFQLQIDENIKSSTNRQSQSNGSEFKLTSANKNSADLPMRRMTLLERLAENKTKKLNESLSRMTISKSDYDTEED